MTVTVPTQGMAEPVVVSYVVKGAALRTADGDTAVVWDLLQGLSLPVSTFDAVVSIPAILTMVDCASGDPTDPGACVSYSGGTHTSPQPMFHDESLNAGDVVRATFGLAAERHDRDGHCVAHALGDVEAQLRVGARCERTRQHEKPGQRPGMTQPCGTRLGALKRHLHVTP